MTPSANPYATLSELVEMNARRGKALQLIAEAVEAMKDAPEAVKAIGIVARTGLGSQSSSGG